MTLPRQTEQQLIDNIIEQELKMFLAVQSADGPASCQQNPSSFKAVRWMTHSVFPEAYLRSYLDDLHVAQAKGINLMTIKYGRMDDLIPIYNASPLIDRITDFEQKWIQDLRHTAPEAFREEDAAAFRRYFACELETLSEKTLQVYLEVVTEAQQNGRNLAHERYINFRNKFGMTAGPVGATG